MAVVAPPTSPTGDPYAGADLECDIVMKGGITSGVVYPGAITALAKRYRFRSIGGTSAGGIAAAVVAAAEHNRAAGGFRVVEAMAAEMAKEAPDGRPFMFQLFQPDRPTRRLFRAIVAYMEHDRLRALHALWAFRRFLLVAIAVVAVSVASALLGADAAFAVAGVALAGAILVVGTALDAWGIVKRLPENDYGLCRLGPDVGTPEAPALSGWLHGRIQAAAGPGAPSPLTFADLWGVSREDPKSDRRSNRLIERSRDAQLRAVDLQMMTTDLTHGRPVRLPVPYQSHDKRLEEGGGLYYDPEELRHFFDPDVMRHLEAFAPPTSEKSAERLRRFERGVRLRHFPIGPDLPVVVATRMSLSFPFLISAIPLWELDFEQYPEEPPLQRVYFSDGGITSNFPVHFFDSPLPTRPTFGLHLTNFEAGRTPDPADPCSAIEGPPRPAGRAPEPTAAIEGLGSFVGALKDATQNWRDNAQARLPGFRERIVHIKLTSKEGGLNLAMDSDTIRHLDARGTCAGEQLVKTFTRDRSHDDDGPNPAPHWNDHRFARYRIALSGLDRVLRSLHRGYTTPVSDPWTQTYRDRVKAGCEAPYAFGSDDDLRHAEATAEAYVEMVTEWGGKSLDDSGVPRPPSALRAVPPV